MAAGLDGKANWNRDVLERIVALLFALAGLADLAADAPFLRRRRVLDILSHGEAEVRAFVAGMVFDAPASAEAPDDAARLAASFRALALALCVMLTRWIERPDVTCPPRLAEPRRELARPADRRASPPAPDTS